MTDTQASPTALRDALEALSNKCVAFWLQVIEAQLACTPPFDGGYVNAGLWASSACPVYQEDATASLSPGVFRRFFAQAGPKVWEIYPQGILHLHSAGLQHLSIILHATPPPVVEVNLDPAGPTVEELEPAFRQVQERTRLEILGVREQIADCKRRLGAAGTAYWILEETP